MIKLQNTIIFSSCTQKFQSALFVLTWTYTQGIYFKNEDISLRNKEEGRGIVHLLESKMKIYIYIYIYGHCLDSSPFSPV